MATIVDLLEAHQEAGLPTEVVPDFLTNGHGLDVLPAPRLGYLHHTVARVLESVYYDRTARPGWPAREWRPDVPAPRCNLYGARARPGGCRPGCRFKGVAHNVFVSAGRAHHAGRANLERIRLARAGRISVRVPDAAAAGLVDDYTDASSESVGYEIDWAEGEDWPADLLDLGARTMRLTVDVFDWPGVGCWIHHRQATRRKPDLAYRGDIWARAAAITIKEDDMSAADVAAINKHTAAKLDEMFKLLQRGETENGKVSAPHAMTSLSAIRRQVDLAAGQLTGLGAVRVAQDAIRADQQVQGALQEKALALLAEIEAELPEPAGPPASTR